jgi:hypothetical protein
MAKRIHALCAHLVAEHGGAVEALWTAGEPDGPEVPARSVEQVRAFKKQAKAAAKR